MTSLALQSEPLESPTLALPQPSAATAPWSLAKRVGFRFAFVYFVLFLLPSPLSWIPGLIWFPMNWQKLTRAVTAWTGIHILHLQQPITYQPTGSGDTLANYVSHFAMLLIAILATIVWSILDRRRPQYRQIYAWLSVYVRYGLAAIMLGYGFAKVWPLQMQYPTLDRLVEPLGDFSPMGLLWTFMGFSASYLRFTGLGETIGALLLFTRRTATAGALLLMVVMANVFMLNMTFDVPVKLFSLHYLVMAAFIAGPDFARLFNVLVLNRATSPREPVFLFPRRWMRIAGTVAASAFVVLLVYPNYTGSVQRYKTGPGARRPPLFGIYNVTDFTRNGVNAAALSSGPAWKRVTFSNGGAAAILSTTELTQRYTARVDTMSHVLTLAAGQRGAALGTLAYTMPESGHLTLVGRVGADSIEATLDRYDTQMTLTNRGFQWIEELPFNR